MKADFILDGDNILSWTADRTTDPLWSARIVRQPIRKFVQQ
jgi:hypothetical protein